MKQKQIFNKLISERRDESIQLSEKVNYDDLTHHFMERYMSDKSCNNFQDAFKANWR